MQLVCPFDRLLSPAMAVVALVVTARRPGTPQAPMKPNRKGER